MSLDVIGSVDGWAHTGSGCVHNSILLTDHELNVGNVRSGPSASLQDRLARINLDAGGHGVIGGHLGEGGWCRMEA